uniref:mesoderm posterior protein 1-like n=1 Tax=Podarcis muralis TaxID=64176 RepID=UPI00109F378A|nr:mesoderm posterior protein 1-like [Podarcis muralis]
MSGSPAHLFGQDLLVPSWAMTWGQAGSCSAPSVGICSPSTAYSRSLVPEQAHRWLPKARAPQRASCLAAGSQRQSASQREKHRMRRLAQALHTLRLYLPTSVAPAGQSLTKIETLRLAIRYITHLSEQLGLSEEALAQRRAGLARPHCPLCFSGLGCCQARRSDQDTTESPAQDRPAPETWMGSPPCLIGMGQGVQVPDSRTWPLPPCGLQDETPAAVAETWVPPAPSLQIQASPELQRTPCSPSPCMRLPMDKPGRVWPGEQTAADAPVVTWEGPAWDLEEPPGCKDGTYRATWNLPTQHPSCGFLWSSQTLRG